MMEGSSNANVFFDTRHRCAKNSAASVAISESAEERNFQDEESVTLSALLGGGGSMASGTSSDVGFSTGEFVRFCLRILSSERLEYCTSYLYIRL